MSTEWMRDYLKYDSLSWDAIELDDELPTLVREVDATLVVVGAIASRDMYPVHHDREFAQRAGAPDVFMNILTTNGLMATYVTNWCGHGWDLASNSLRLMVPNFPGTKMTASGRVARKWSDDGGRYVEISFSADNDRGPHCTGSAIIREAASEDRSAA